MTLGCEHQDTKQQSHPPKKKDSKNEISCCKSNFLIKEVVSNEIS